MKNPIILLSGGTGVGTSRFSLELAKTLNISTIVSTDMVREVIRNIISPKINPVLDKSTYLAGQTKNYSQKSDEVQNSEILRAYKTQCEPIHVAVDGVISRYLKENKPVIIEGVHLLPGKVRNHKLYPSFKNRLIEFVVGISDSEIHKERFIQRQKDAPERFIEKYIDNFKEIRLIHNYICDRAKRFEDVKFIDNSKNIEKGLDSLLSFYYSR